MLANMNLQLSVRLFSSHFLILILDFNRIISSKETSDLRTRSIYHRAGTFVKLKRYENAIDDLRGLLRTDPNSLYPRMLLGKALKMIGDLQSAEESVSRGIDLDPKLPDSYIERGDIRCRMATKRKIDEAISGCRFLGTF
jgi:tetratricopeptide (TPR) repeat protein